MGHNSENLLFEPELGAYAGAILSPVNYTQADTAEQLELIGKKLPSSFVALLDPQMYVPQSAREKLREWSYFPQDADTADVSSLAWWSAVNTKILSVCSDLDIGAVATPVYLPKGDLFTDEYFAAMVQIGNDMVAQTAGKVAVRQTAVISLRELAAADRSMQIASLLSATTAERIYLMFKSDVAPRRELADSEQLSGAVRLVHELRAAGLDVLVG